MTIPDALRFERENFGADVLELKSGSDVLGERGLG
jgi:hypothetical protein